MFVGSSAAGNCDLHPQVNAKASWKMLLYAAACRSRKASSAYVALDSIRTTASSSQAEVGADHPERRQLVRDDPEGCPRPPHATVNWYGTTKTEYLGSAPHERLAPSAANAVACDLVIRFLWSNLGAAL